MWNDILTIVKKEFDRFFKDKRLVFTTVLMPGLLIFVIYSFMGKGFATRFNASETSENRVLFVNRPTNLTDYFVSPEIMLYQDVSMDEANQNKDKLLSKEIAAIVIFPENFEQKVRDYNVADGEDAPNVEIYYNSVDPNSSSVYSHIYSGLNSYEQSVSNKFDINNYNREGKYDQATSKERTGMLFSSIMPLLLIIFLYSGCMSMAPDAIAGEKERGTIATLLVTPMKRSSLALGKVLSLCFFSLLSGMSSFLGTMLSMPSLMGGGLSSSDVISIEAYTARDYLLLFAIVVSTVMLFVSVLAVISAFAKNTKEAGGMVVPFMILIMGVALSSIMGSDKPLALKDAIIPIYGTAKSIASIFAFQADTLYVIIAVCVNFVIAGIMTFVLTKMFDNEQIMFSNN